MDKLLSECKPIDVLEAFGSDELLSIIDYDDVTSFVDVHPFILDSVDTLSLLEATEPKEVVDYMKDCGYIVIGDNFQGNDDDIKEILQTVTRSLQPQGCITKDDIKKILCDFVEHNFDRCI